MKYVDFLGEEHEVPDAEPNQCPWCRKVEPSESLLQTNHWPVSALSLEERACIAMNLTRNHLIYDLQEGRDPRMSEARARDVWPVGQHEWIDEMMESAYLPTLF